jgi:hypothetical protein
MIIVRNVFHLKFGKAKDIKPIIEEAIGLMKNKGVKSVRAMFDLTGDSYTMVFESGHESLADFESKIQDMLGSTEWEAMYQKMIPLVDSAHREIYTVIGE